MLRGHRAPWLPWVLCWLSLALMLPGLILQIALPAGADGGLFYAGISVLGVLLVPVVGALIAARLPENPYGWLWCALGLAYGVLLVSDGLERAGAVPAWVAAVLMDAGLLAAPCLLVYVFLLFPTGRLPGRSWRWLGRAAVLLAGAGLLVLPFAPVEVGGVVARSAPWAVSGGVGDVLAGVARNDETWGFILVLPAAASVLFRFLRAGPVEKQQLKWFLFAAVLTAMTIGLDVLAVPLSPAAWAVIGAVTFGLLPAAVGIAVLRYRLYDIDRIVSRTVSYGLLTGGLVALYLALVAVLRPLLEPVTGSSALAVAGSTLAVAAVFDPARRRLQVVVDRRFDRARYDAARAVDAFAARLRDQVDLDQVTAGLRDTVAATVVPTRVGIWLRGPSVPAGSGP